MNAPWKKYVWSFVSVALLLAARDRGVAWAQGAAADSIPADLGPSTAPAWVPDRPVASDEPWEHAVRFPGRIATLPLSGLGYVTRHLLLEIEQTNFVNRVRVTFEPIPRAGFRFTTASLGDRTGSGLGVAYSPPVIKRHLTARWEGSTLKYNRTSVDASYGPARLGYRYEWRPRERFYGLGPSSDEEDETTYATQSQSVTLGFEQQIRRDAEKDSPRWTIGAWLGPRELVTRHGRQGDDPSFEELFPSLLPLLDRRVEHLVYGGRLELDHRRGKPHWGEGGRTSVEVERFGDPVQALAFRTTHAPFRYTRWTIQGEGGVSFHRDPRTLRLQLQVVDNDPDASNTILPPELAALGGAEGLTGFAPGRFHDFDSVVGKLSYIFPIALRVEVDVHTELGQVARDVWKDASIGALQQSYGFAFRPRFNDAVLGMIGLDWSRDMVRFRFSAGGVE